MKQRQQLAAQFDKEIQKSDDDLVKAEAQPWKEFQSATQDSLNSMVPQFIRSGGTLKSVFSSLATDILDAWVNMELKRLEQTVLTNDAITASFAASDRQIAVAHSLAKAQGLSGDAAMGSAQIINDAYKALDTIEIGSRTFKVGVIDAKMRFAARHHIDMIALVREQMVALGSSWICLEEKQAMCEIVRLMLLGHAPGLTVEWVFANIEDGHLKALGDEWKRQCLAQDRLRVFGPALSADS
jgi:hypothetical protein